MSFFFSILESSVTVAFFLAIATLCIGLVTLSMAIATIIAIRWRAWSSCVLYAILFVGFAAGTAQTYRLAVQFKGICADQAACRANEKEHPSCHCLNPDPEPWW